jgi:hypothetical protein
MSLKLALIVAPCDVPRSDAVVAASVDLPADLDTATLRVIDTETGASLPCQYVASERRLYLQMRGETAAGQRRDFTVRQAGAPVNHGQSVALREELAVLDVLLDGAPFTVYNYASTHRTLHRPYFYPILGPTGLPIVQHGEFPGTLRGHYWHSGLFIAHQKVNGISFWEEREGDGRILHREFTEQVQGAVFARFTEDLEWRAPDGTPLLAETRTVTIPYGRPERRFLDVTLALRAEEQDVTFGATPYHLLACRLPNAMCLVEQKRQYAERWGKLVEFGDVERGGSILNSEGREAKDALGASARWIDFSGPLGGAWCGVTLFDHPRNPRHPTPMNNWNNMTLALSPTYHEPLVLPRGETATWQYRVYIHAGNHEQARVEEAWEEFARPGVASVVGT